LNAYIERPAQGRNQEDGGQDSQGRRYTWDTPVAERFKESVEGKRSIQGNEREGSVLRGGTEEVTNGETTYQISENRADASVQNESGPASLQGELFTPEGSTQSISPRVKLVQAGTFKTGIIEVLMNEQRQFNFCLRAWQKYG